MEYVVGSERAEAAVVDPTRRTDQFGIDWDPEKAAVTIDRVLDTHVHAGRVG